LGVRLPLLPPFSSFILSKLRDWSSGTTPGFQPGDRGSNPRSRFDKQRSVPGRAVRRGLPRSDRRVRLPRGALGNRLTGRLPDFESGGGGSNPPSRTPGQLLVVVTPRSERGGRWFDSSPRNSFTTTEANRPDQGPVLKTGGGAGRLWVRVPRLPPDRSGTPIGRAAWFKPRCLWVRLPP
jgi:hypothetical protein